MMTVAAMDLSEVRMMVSLGSWRSDERLEPSSGIVRGGALAGVTPECSRHDTRFGRPAWRWPLEERTERPRGARLRP